MALRNNLDLVQTQTLRKCVKNRPLVLLKTSSNEKKRKKNLKVDICFKKEKRKNLWDSIKFAYGAV